MTGFQILGRNRSFGRLNINKANITYCGVVGAPAFCYLAQCEQKKIYTLECRNWLVLSKSNEISTEYNKKHMLRNNKPITNEIYFF